MALYKALLPAPKARNMKARGKREAQRNASPLVTRIILKRALKVRNINQLFRSFRASWIQVPLPGATRLTLFGACPWLSYCAHLALASDFPTKNEAPVRRLIVWAR